MKQLKALDILKSARSGGKVYFTHAQAQNKYYDEAISELEALQEDFKLLQQELKDANEAYLILLKQYIEQQNTPD